MFPELNSYDDVIEVYSCTQYDHNLQLIVIWKAIALGNNSLCPLQDDVCKMGQDILKLGLLFGSLQGDEASVDEQPEWLTFAHKLFQDFAAGFYISKTKVNVT